MPTKKASTEPKQADTKKPAKVTKKTVQKVPVSAPVVETKVVEPVAVVEAKVEDVEVSDPTESTTAEFCEFGTRLTAVRTSLSNLLQDFKALQKRTERELKLAHKNNSKRKRKTGTRQPSGFVKPTLISNELAAFLGKPMGTELARTEVTREINTYIRANKLQDPANGRKINPDAKLTKLLSIKPEDELTYFNLQRYMSPHFQKIGAAPLNA